MHYLSQGEQQRYYPPVYALSQHYLHSFVLSPLQWRTSELMRPEDSQRNQMPQQDGNDRKPVQVHRDKGREEAECLSECWMSTMQLWQEARI